MRRELGGGAPSQDREQKQGRDDPDQGDEVDEQGYGRDVRAGGRFGLSGIPFRGVRLVASGLVGRIHCPTLADPAWPGDYESDWTLLDGPAGPPPFGPLPPTPGRSRRDRAAM